MGIVEADREGVDWNKYDTVIIGCAVIYGKMNRELVAFVNRFKAVLDAKAAAGKDQGHILRGGQANGNSRGDHLSSPGGNHLRGVDAGVQVHGRRTRGGIVGERNIAPNFRGKCLDFQLHNDKLPNKFL